MKSYSFKLILRVMLLFISMLLLAFMVGRANLLYTQVILGCIVLGLTTDLLRLISNTNRSFTRMLLAVQHDDFTLRHQAKYTDLGYPGFYQAMRKVQDTIREARVEKVAQLNYLQAIIDQMEVGIISLEEDYSISLINEAALNQLQTGRYSHWHNLKVYHPEFAAAVERMEPGNSKLVQVPVQEVTRQFFVQHTAIRVRNRSLKIYTLQDIDREMSQQEVEAWVRLIRILSHEIMNSLTPVTSLTESMIQLLQRRPVNAEEDDLKEDLQLGLSTIHRRSRHLTRFVSNYRQFMSLPPPEKKWIEAAPFIQGIQQLLQAELKGITFTTSLEPAGLGLFADPVQLEQVMINLIKNSIEALAGQSHPQVKITVYAEDEGCYLTVEDNGEGIERKNLNSIFVPFFSTKEKGSGIGLSLGRQIILAHRGTLWVTSETGKFTRFTIGLPGPVSSPA